MGLVLTTILPTVFEYISSTPFVLVWVVVLLACYVWMTKARYSSNSLPIFLNLPLVGSVPWLLWCLYRTKLPFYEVLRQKTNIYGNIFGFNIFGQLVVMLNDYQSIKKAFDNPDLSGRPSTGLMKRLGLDKGIVLSSGELWSQQRKLTQKTFRSFGVGFKHFDERIAIESQALIAEIANFKGDVLDPEPLLVNAVSNVICSVVFGKRFDYSDDKFRRFQSLTKQQYENGAKAVQGDFLPVLRHFLTQRKKLAEKNLKELHDFLDGIICEHKATFDPEHLRDYMDVYINELRLKANGSITKCSSLDEHSMKHTICQLFTAGTATTAQTIFWGLAYLVAYPDVQSRVQREIDDVIGRNILPRYSDKPSLPYTCATIFEIQRMASGRLVTAPHLCGRDTVVCGVHIPKGAIVFPLLWSVHRDPEVWNEPNMFKPERFLDHKGELIQHEKLIPFNAGRRICLGDKLATMELFIFLTHLLHQFTFEPASFSGSSEDPGDWMNPKNPKMRALKRE